MICFLFPFNKICYLNAYLKTSEQRIQQRCKTKCPISNKDIGVRKGKNFHFPHICDKKRDISTKTFKKQI